MLPNLQETVNVLCYVNLSKCDQILIFTEEILNGKLHFFVQ